MVQRCIRCANGHDHWAMARNADQADPMAGEGLRVASETLATKSEEGPAFPLHVAVA